MFAWNEHPIAKTQTEIDDYNISTKREWKLKRFAVYRSRRISLSLCECYTQRLLVDGFITPYEYKDLVLLPYIGLLKPSIWRKTEIEAHKTLFLCEEEALYPLILRQLIRYLSYLFDEAGIRRELLLDVVHFAEKQNRREIYRMAKEGCRLGEIINKFNLQKIYEANPNRAEAYYYCLMSKNVTQQI